VLVPTLVLGRGAFIVRAAATDGQEVTVFTHNQEKKQQAVDFSSSSPSSVTPNPSSLTFPSPMLWQQQHQQQQQQAAVAAASSLAAGFFPRSLFSANGQTDGTTMTITPPTVGMAIFKPDFKSLHVTLIIFRVTIRIVVQNTQYKTETLLSHKNNAITCL